MADKDLSQKALLEYPDVFADIYNTLIFNGREILKPDELKQITTEYISNPDHKGWKQLFRDVVMENTTTGVRYMILGIENQATPDSTMPHRGMGRQKEPEMDHHQETMLAMAALTGDRRYVELTAKEKEEELMGRCKMLDYLEEEAIARGTAKGMAQGMAQGLDRGKQLQIIELVIKKCARGMSVAQIAEQVEENADLISTICNVIVECGSGCTSEMVYSKMNS